MSKERRLGRGLEALLGRSLDGAGPVAPADGFASSSDGSPGSGPFVDSSIVNNGDVNVTRSEDGQQWLPLCLITPNPYQPREAFDEAEIADLCDSIRAHGFLQPIVVRRHGDGYQIVAGERRLRAAQLAAWERVPVQIREVDDRQMAELAIVEN
ncbi:MAG TPA: ParB/RepB/Spo0J family partition protein, partial [Pirellulaceae bacterium]|nr:ParB/RepB/Spo0J family partition protein [Pirellulaceae bacterium]